MVFQGDLYFKYIYLEKNRVNYLKLNAVIDMCNKTTVLFFPVTQCSSLNLGSSWRIDCKITLKRPDAVVSQTLSLSTIIQ